MSNGRKNDFGKLISTIIFFVLVGIFIFSTYKIICVLDEEKQSRQIVSRLQEKAVETETQEQSDDNQESDVYSSAEEDQIPIKIDFNVLKEECPDIIAWIYCPDTPINYPVVQGPDNQYYLRKLISGEYNIAGTLFADYKNSNDFSDKNTVIYGHNMKNKTMFGSLPMYKQQEYFDNHPVMYLLTADHNFKVELVSSFITSADSYLYNVPINDSDFDKLVSELTDKSDIKTDVIPDAEDKLVTLSTCSYEYDGARRIVIGVLKELNLK